ncbi:glycosyltransferase family 4 protein [Komagataeibacter swingsii]|uniref:Glycosyltransferase family 4 protein n=1 Tax=Komagataeibacter swingsii TaxID=215220 RepID=A0A850P2E0_9PROT|nr:glycosyltransferase family 1 protein [Komagataeibacter swingsii]NVN36556.1 glycosyltransferase family 4 protein [Komagataeibacter swingsii]
MPAPPFPDSIWLDGRNIGIDSGTGVTQYAHDLSICLNDLNISTDFIQGQDTAQVTSSPPNTDALKRLLRAFLPKRSIITIPSTKGHDIPYCHDLYRTAHVRFKTFHRLTSLRTIKPPTIMHWTYPLPMVLEGCPNILTIHDLVPLLNPELTGIESSLFAKLLRLLCKRMDRIVTVSETVRKQVINVLQLPQQHVVNLYQMVDINKTDVMKSPRIIPPDSLIHIGRVESRKNIERLIKAYCYSKSRRSLILVGPNGDDFPDLTLPSGSPGQIIRIPWIERSSLLRGLSEAHALVFPSLAEGFGLPIIEAMALGTPVITSRGSATEEIAGGAACLIDPLSVDDIADKILMLDSTDKNKGLAGALVKKGYQRASFFSRKAYTERLKKFYNSIVP